MDGVLRDAGDQVEVGLDAGEDLGGEDGLVLREPREAPVRPRARAVSAECVRRRRRRRRRSKSAERRRNPPRTPRKGGGIRGEEAETHVSSECSSWSLTSPIQSGMPISAAMT